MLRKLMKHELRATTRTMLPLFGIILLLSLGMLLISRAGGFDSGGSPSMLNVISVLISVAYSIALGAVFLVVLVLMINRFRTNLLGDEGYIMLTLPVSVHRILWSKIITSCLWFVASILVVTLSAIIVSADGGTFREMSLMLQEVWAVFTSHYAGQATLFLIEGLLLFFFSYVAGCVMFYAAMAFGHGFSRRKTLWTLGFFFGTQFLLQLLFSSMAISNLWDLVWFSDLSDIAAAHTVLLGLLAVVLVLSAVFYFVTNHCLQKRLNIE